jgi:hypothetical protein
MLLDETLNSNYDAAAPIGRDIEFQVRKLDPMSLLLCKPPPSKPPLGLPRSHQSDRHERINSSEHFADGRPRMINNERLTFPLLFLLLPPPPSPTSA